MDLSLISQDKTSIESSPVVVMTRGQPELTGDVLSQVEVVRRGPEVTVTALWSDLLLDGACRAPQRAFIRFRPETEDDWEEEELSLNTDRLNATIQLSEYCLPHHFQLVVVGFPGTEPVTLDMTELLPDSEVEVCPDQEGEESYDDYCITDTRRRRLSCPQWQVWR